MFTVPGWSVPASSLVQQQHHPKNTSQSDPEKKKKKQTKRKRNNEPTGVEDHKSHSVTTYGVSSRKRLRRDGGNGSVQDEDSSNRRTKETPRRRIATEHQSQPSRSPTDSKFTKKQNGNQLRTFPSDASTNDIVRHEVSSAVTPRAHPNPGISSHTNLKLTPLQAKMRDKLTSARFRHLNETLYTTSSNDAMTLFTNSPDLFAEYHAGFSQQVKDSWPQNPVEGYIKSIRARGALAEAQNGVMPLPRRKTGSCTIADLGCGDAPLARGCQSVVKSSRLKFHNYDLHAPNSFVNKADISNLPLRDGEADIVVFCLSLMGTNWVSFVEEAWRILRGDGRGEIWVAEVKSRFGQVVRGRVVENSVGKRRKKQKSRPDRPDDDTDHLDGREQFAEDERTADVPEDETDISNFVKVFTRRGFQLRDGSVNKSNKMFVSMVFSKSGIPTTGKHKGLKWSGKEYVKQAEQKARFVNGQKDDTEIDPTEEAKALKPCIYKKR